MDSAMNLSFCDMDRSCEAEYIPNGKMESVVTEPINIIQLKHGDINTEQDVVIKHSRLTQGKIIPIPNSHQSYLLKEEVLIRIITIGDNRYLSLPQTSEPFAIIIPGVTPESELPVPSPPPLNCQEIDTKAGAVRKSSLSAILPKLAMKAAMSKREMHSEDKPVKSKRKSGKPCKKTDSPQRKTDQPVGKPYSCDQCKNSYTSKYSLKTHQVTNHKTNFYNCEHCSERFLHRSDWLKHTETHPGASHAAYTCEICGEHFSRKKALKSHEIIHNPNEYICEHCPKKFKYKTNFKRHILAHEKKSRNHSDAANSDPTTKEDNTTCKDCSKTFKNALSLKSHRRVHINETAPHACEKCGKRFESPSGLKYHMDTHLEEKPLMCEHCGQRFLRNEGLKRHMRIHTGEKPYECSYCQKRFSQQKNLIQHERIHTGEKPYSCDYCGRTFARHTACSEHKRIHTGERPYMCEYCGKDFRRSTYYRVHLRLHTGDNPFKCEFCTKGYPQKVQLKLHMRSNHPDRPEIS